MTRTSLSRQKLVGRSMTSLVGSPEGNQTNSRADIQHLTKGEFIQNRGILAPFSSSSYKGKADKSPFILGPSFSFCNMASHPKGEITQDYPSWVKHCAGSTCILWPMPTTPGLGTMLSPDKKTTSTAPGGNPSPRPWGLPHQTSTWPDCHSEKSIISKASGYTGSRREDTDHHLPAVKKSLLPVHGASAKCPAGLTLSCAHYRKMH